MWALDNRTAHQAERGWYVDKDGRTHWIVVVKSTFDIRADGSLILSDDPVPPLLAPVYFGVDGASSLRYEADVGGPKAATDVVINGTAHAPGGGPTTELHVAVHLGRLRKIIEVTGDREYQRKAGFVTEGSPQPFVTMPLVYERAFGGFDNHDPEPRRQRLDTRNPVGRGCAIRSGSLVGTLVPNLVIPGRPATSGPAGFGSIASHWSPRREYAGTYDERWAAERRPLLPVDFDPRHHQHAPVDQQLSPHLRGGELVELVNLTPSGVLRFELPKIGLAMTTHFGRERLEHRPQLVTVVVEPDVPRVIMAWQSVIPCHHLVDKLDMTAVREKPYL